MINLQNNTHNTPAFGCRMMAFVKSGQPTIEDDVIRTDCLVNSPQSLKAQSAPGLIHRDGIVSPYNCEDLYKSYYLKGNDDGWGVLAYCRGQQPYMLSKSYKPAFQDSGYDQAVGALNYYHPRITLAHVRLTTETGRDNNNSHPFVYNNWSFEHNGCLPVVKKTPFSEKINGEYARLLGDAPKGHTDSEALFYYFLGRMKQTYETIDSNAIGTENVAKIFARSMLEVVDKEKESHKVLDGSINDLQGTIDLSPSCDIIMSDGKDLFALRKGHTLYLGRYINALNQRQYIISNEKTNTYRTGKPIEWVEVPEEHVVIIKQHDNGIYRPYLYPIIDLVPEYNTVSEHL